MRVSKTRQVVKTEEYDVHNICDKCEIRIPDPKSFQVSEFKLEERMGSNYGNDGGEIETKTLDLCETCRSDLFDLLAKNGFMIQSSVYDW
jgi:Zn finger protein HypA/HybF involved in hydrogenase expression